MLCEVTLVPVLGGLHSWETRSSACSLKNPTETLTVIWGPFVRTSWAICLTMRVPSQVLCENHCLGSPGYLSGSSIPRCSVSGVITCLLSCPPCPDSLCHVHTSPSRHSSGRQPGRELSLEKQPEGDWGHSSHLQEVLWGPAPIASTCGCPPRPSKIWSPLSVGPKAYWGEEGMAAGVRSGL